MNITKRAKNIDPQWWLINAENKILGRLATRVADLLAGKRKVYYSHDIVCGDIVVVINAEKVKLTGNKLKIKKYRWHTGYPGHLKEKTAGEMLKRKPGYLISQAVKGMLPKNKLQAILLKRLKVYAGEKHPHKAQQPILLELEKKKDSAQFLKFQKVVEQKKEKTEEQAKTIEPAKEIKKEPEKTKQTEIQEKAKEKEKPPQKAQPAKTEMVKNEKGKEPSKKNSKPK